MFVEMSCQCGASLQIDGADDNATWIMSTRFAESHTVCGFVSPINKDQPDTTVRYDLKFKQKRIFAEDEED